MFAINPNGNPIHCSTIEARRRRTLCALSGMLLLFGVFAEQLVFGGPPPREIHSVVELLSLSNEEASHDIPVHLRGVVIMNSPSRYVSFIQDGNVGVYVPNSPDKPLLAVEGDLIDVVGITGRGKYAPILMRRKVVVLSHPGMPKPIPASSKDIQEDRYQNAWVEIEGVVTAVRTRDLLNVQTLDLKVGGERFELTAAAKDLSANDVELGALARVRAILGSESNAQGERRGAELFLRSKEDIKVLRPGKTNWPAIPFTDLSRLLRYHGVGHIGDLINVRGTITLQGADYRLQIQDGNTAVSADPSAASDLVVGDCVELIGFLNNRASIGLWLNDAMGRKCGEGRVVTPLKADGKQIVSPNAAGLLIEIDGIVVQESNGIRSDVLYLVTPDNDQLPFVAELFHGRGKDAMPKFLAGDRVRLTGVYDVDEARSGLQGANRRVILRTNLDAKLIFRRPWWKRVPWLEVATGALCFLALLFGWNLALRREVTRKTSALEEQSVALIEARDRAEAGARAKSDFLSTMSHEIRTPLNGVIGMTDLLLETPLSAEQLDFAETIKGSGETLLHLINEILDFSKVESGRLSLEIVNFDVRTLVEQSVAMVIGEARRKRLAFDVSVAADVPQLVRGDPTRIRQIVLNLLSNAIKFTDVGGVGIRVHSVTGADDQRPSSPPKGCPRQIAHVRFEISDTGIGIKPEARANIFQSFTQADSSTTRRFGGTGLGLAISKRLVELMGGSVAYESELNLGSTFWFEVPLEITEREQDPSSVQSQPLGARLGTALAPASSRSHFDSPTGPLQVLLVEDNFSNQKLAQAMLERLGCRVDVVRNGVEAIRASSLGSFDLILMDCQMPEMDGYSATAAIRKAEGRRGQHTPIIALTASAMKGDQERCLAAGMDDYLTKPIALETLADAISRWQPGAPRSSSAPVVPKLV